MFSDWVVPMLLHVIFSVFFFLIVAHFSVLPPASCNGAFMALFVVCSCFDCGETADNGDKFS